MTSGEARGDRGRLAAAGGALFVLTVVMFHDGLLSRQTVLSSAEADLPGQFIPWYAFGFRELLRGNFPLWNPHLFSGAPFHAGFQGGLLYPPNWLHLVLPTPTAVNLLMALHVFLAGFFTLLWLSRRGLHPVACFVAATVLMFSGPHFLQVQAGHLPHLATIAWAPLLYLSIDAFVATRRPTWCLAGMGVIATMILAGYPQHVFSTGVAAGIYALMLLAGSRRRLHLAAGLLAMGAGAAALAAAQLLPGVAAVTESVRARGVPFAFAESFSFPPENLVTLLAPEFFGRSSPYAYWGRWYPWEMTLFFGVTGLALAVCGARRGERRPRGIAVAMVLVTLLLALGSSTPIFRALYAFVPGFDMYRGTSKFTLQTALFVALLAGMGLDRLLRAGERPAGLPPSLAVAGAALGLGAGVLFAPAGDGAVPAWWQRAWLSLPESAGAFLPREAYADPAFALRALAGARGSLCVAAGTLVLLAVLFRAAPRHRKIASLVACLAVVEVFAFAWRTRASFDVGSLRTPLERVLREHPGDYRVLNTADPNSAMTLGAHDLWGYDHGVTRRYAELMAFTQGLDPDAATQNLAFTRPSPLFRMLRLRYAFFDDEIGTREVGGALPRVLVVRNVRVLQGRDRIFAALADDFDASREVVLETVPDPLPVPAAGGDPGTARVVDESTDHLTIDADLPGAGVLVITDAFAAGWRAVGLPGSAQREYRVLPANYALRAVPLRAGRHRLRVEYRPAPFVAGLWVSCLSLPAFLALSWRWTRGRRPGRGARRGEP